MHAGRPAVRPSGLLLSTPTVLPAADEPADAFGWLHDHGPLPSSRGSMTNVYMVRHQSAGLVAEYVFAAPPTPQQLAVIGRVCAQRCGERHLRTGEPLWMTVVELSVLDGADLAMPPPPGANGKANASGVGAVSVSAVGHVENPPAVPGV